MREKLKSLIPPFLLGITYIVFIHIFTYGLYASGNLYLSSAPFKEILFGIWGYAWDGMHYLKIATEGYKFPLQAFFPLYPFVINIADLFLPQTLAHRINLILIFVMLFSLDKLLQINGIEKKRRLFSLVAFLSLPMSFFLIANYSETLYILIGTLVLITWYKHKFFLGSILGTLLSATKITGIVISILFLFKGLSSTGEGMVKRFKYLLYSGISITGALTYFSFLQITYDDWNIFFEAQREWKRSTGISINSITDFINKYRYPVESELFRNYLEIGILIFLITALTYLWNKMPRYIWFYSLLHIIIPISTGSLLSLPRLSLLAFPLYLWFFAKINSKIGIVIIIGFSILQLYSVYLFFNNVFVG